MIVVGIDPYMKTHTAVAIEAVSGRHRGERTVACDPAGHDELLAWARASPNAFPVRACSRPGSNGWLAAVSTTR